MTPNASPILDKSSDYFHANLCCMQNWQYLYIYCKFIHYKLVQIEFILFLQLTRDELLTSLCE